MSAETETETVEFDPASIRSRLPSGLNNKQERAMICAVRNPDAGFREIGDATGVDHSSVQNALEAVARGIVGGHHSGEWIIGRGSIRDAEAFEELTDKQQAVIEFLARNPSFDWQSHTGPQFTSAVLNAEYTDDGLNMSPTYPHKIAEKYDDLVESRRETLLAMGEELDSDDTEYDGFNPTTPREYLNAAGLSALPEENLDSLGDYGDTPAVPDDDRLEVAFERASEIQRDPSVSLDLGAGEFEDHLHESREEFDDDDVGLGDGYIGVVNGKVDWGLWVTIGGDPDDPNDVSGVVPVENVENAGHSLDEYEVGDPLRVVVVGRSNVHDGKTRHRFDIPTVDRLPTTAGRAANATADESDEDAASEAEAAFEGTTTSDDAEAATSAAQAVTNTDAEGLATLSERVADLSRHVEHLAERVDENAEALPDDETARQLNEAAETVLHAADALDAFEDRLDGIEDRLTYVEAMESDVDTMSESLAEGLDRLDTHEADLDMLADRIDALESRTDADTGTDDVTIVDAIEVLEAAGVEYQITATNTTPEEDDQ